jgi:Na+-driven multidrug efflux pump
MEGLFASDFVDGDHYSTSLLYSSSKALLPSEETAPDIFTQYPPFPRLLYLSVGPLISQIALSLSGFADSFWVAKACGPAGLAIFGAVFIVDFIAVAVGQYLITGLSARASFLFGSQDASGCAQLFVDFIRIAVGAALVVPAVVLPITRPLIEWFGGDRDFSYSCFQYMLPSTCGSFVTFVYMICCGMAQAEGRSMTFGLLQVAALGIAQLLFNPLLLMVLKTPVWGASLARICGEAVSAIAGIWLTFGGHFRVKPTPGMFLEPFSRDTWAAMKVGLAELISVCSETLPMVLVQKYTNEAAKAIGVYETVLQVWGVLEKVYQFVVGICVAFALGMLPSAAHSYGARHYKDCLWTSVHTLWFTTLVSVVFSSALVFCPDKVCALWSTDPLFLEWVRKMVPQCFYMAPSFGMLFMVPVLYEAMQKYAWSTAMAFVTQMLPLPIFSSVLHFTDKNDPARILWAYFLTDGFAFVVCAAFYLGPLLRFVRAPPTVEEVLARVPRGRTVSDPGARQDAYVDNRY